MPATHRRVRPNVRSSSAFSPRRRPACIDVLENRTYFSVFATPTFFTGVTSPTAIATADFNGDGKPDIAVAGTAPTSGVPVVAVFLNTGSGSFGKPTLYPQTDSIGGLTVGDFLDNGHIDIAGIDSVGNRIVVLLNDGSGNFTEGVGASVTGAGTDVSIAAGDFNGDGKVDLAVVDPSSNQIDTLFSTGVEGLFATEGSISIPSAGTLVAGVFQSGSKVDDLAVTSSGSPGSVYVALNNRNGSGTFQTPVSYSLGATVSSINGLAMGDFNSGSATDLVAVSPSGLGSSGLAAVLLGSGSGTFGTANDLAVASSAATVVTGDFTGSGHTDIATITPTGGLDLLAGNGDGTFAADQQLFTTDLGTPIKGAVSADFNSDGKDDIAFLTSAGGFGLLLTGSGGSGSSGSSAIAPFLSTPLPTAALVAGAKIKPIHESVRLTDSSSSAFSGSVTINLEVSTGTVVDKSAIAVTSTVTKKLKLKPHKSVMVPFTIKSVPASADGQYYLLANLTDSTGATNSYASTTRLNIQPGFYDLAAAVGKVPATARLNHALSFNFNVINDGNLTASTGVEAKVYLSLSTSIDSSAVLIDDFVHHGAVNPAKTMAIHASKVVTGLTSGQAYHLIVQIDPNNTYADTNLANNIASSASTITFS